MFVIMFYDVGEKRVNKVLKTARKYQSIMNLPKTTHRLRGVIRVAIGLTLTIIKPINFVAI